MKEIQTNNGVILLVMEVPEAAYDFEIDIINYFPQIFYSYYTNKGILDFPLTDSNSSNKESFKILGKLSQISEEDCKRFVNQHPATLFYFNYRYKNLNEVFAIHYELIAKESFISLLQSNDIDVSNEEKILLIEKL